MRTKKAIITTALAVPMLALGGGIAYASTTAGGPPPATRTAVTTTVQTHQPATGQAHHGQTGHRYDQRCDRCDQGHRQPATLRQTTPDSGSRQNDGNHSRDHAASHGNRNYQDNGQHRSGSGHCDTRH